MKILCSKSKGILRRLYELIDTYNQLYLYVDLLLYDVIYSRDKMSINLDSCEELFNDIKRLRVSVSRSLVKIIIHQLLKKHKAYVIYKKDTYLMELIDELAYILCNKNSSFLDIKNLMDKADSMIKTKSWTENYEMD